MTLTTEQIAQVCHEANRALQLIGDDAQPSPAWDEAPQWQRDSAIAGVEAALDGTTPEQQHNTWCNDRLAAGWTHGPVKDAEAKTHPCLVPYHELPAIQQAKDHVFVAIVGALSRT